MRVQARTRLPGTVVGGIGGPSPRAEIAAGQALRDEKLMIPESIWSCLDIHGTETGDKAMSTARLVSP